MQREDCCGEFQKKKNLNEAEEVARGLGTMIFLPGIYRRYIDRKFLWAIPRLLFLVAGKASRELVDP